MTDATTAERDARLSNLGQLYVTTVGAVAVLSVLTQWTWTYVLLVVLALPLSLVAMWVAFYGTLAVGFVIGHEPGHVSLPVAVVWVVVWTGTAWINARLGERVRHSGWLRALGRR